MTLGSIKYQDIAIIISMASCSLHCCGAWPAKRRASRTRQAKALDHQRQAAAQRKGNCGIFVITHTTYLARNVS